MGKRKLGKLNIDKPTTDWKTEFHKSQEKHNQLRKDFSTIVDALSHSRQETKDIKAWLGLVRSVLLLLGGLGVVVCAFFDYLAKFLINTTHFSFTYSEGFSLMQLLGVLAFGLMLVISIYKWGD